MRIVKSTCYGVVVDFKMKKSHAMFTFVLQFD